MAGFTISKVDFANPTGIMQTFSFDYKLWSDPDTNWINISISSTVNTDGTLVTPLTVTGLDPNTLYYIRAANNCNSPLEYFLRQVTTSDIFFLLEGANDYGVNYAASMDIVNGVGSLSISNIVLDYINLPSFCTVVEQEWQGQPLYPYIKTFTISVNPTGIGDSGSYDFVVNATDGNSTISYNYSLTVDNLAYVRFNRPFSQPTSRSINVGDSEIWTYTATANVNGYTVSQSYNNWSQILGGAQLRFTADAIAGQEGNGFIMASIQRTLVSNLYSDSILIFVTVNS